jgi:glycine cleavage system aminomethyltransferase T
VPVEFAVGVFETLHGAGEKFGLVDAGYYAIDSLRIEKGYRAWGRELTPDCNPFEAGLAFACKLAKDIPFRGRDALLRIKAEGVKRRIAALTIDAPDAMLWGGEAILRNGQPAGFLTSAAYGHTLGKPVALGIIQCADAAIDQEYIESGRYEVDLAGKLLPAHAHLRAPVDPSGARVRS